MLLAVSVYQVMDALGALGKFGEARIALGCVSTRLSRLSKLAACIDRRTLNMNQFFHFSIRLHIFGKMHLALLQVNYVVKPVFQII